MRFLLQLAAAIIILTAIVVLSHHLQLGSSLLQFNHRVSDMGLAGMLLAAGAYVLGTLLLLPGSAMTVSAGFVFGAAGGLLVSTMGAIVGVSLAFLIGRFVARGKIERITRNKPRFLSVDRAIRERSIRLIFLLRLSPLIPYNFLNYFLGLTAVRFWPYIFASGLGMLPGALVNVYIGALGKAGVERAAGDAVRRSPWEWALLFGGLGVSIAVTVWISYVAHRAIKEAAQASVEGLSDDPSEERTGKS